MRITAEFRRLSIGLESHPSPLRRIAERLIEVAAGNSAELARMVREKDIEGLLATGLSVIERAANDPRGWRLVVHGGGFEAPPKLFDIAEPEERERKHKWVN